jgi:hypothetical protein
MVPKQRLRETELRASAWSLAPGSKRSGMTGTPKVNSGYQHSAVRHFEPENTLSLNAFDIST